jgi:Peptidase A4 family
VKRIRTSARSLAAVCVLALASGAAATTAAASPGGPAFAGLQTTAARTAETQQSSNWAGYAVTSTDAATGAATSYTAVSGVWVQPKATCAAGRTTYSGFWIGLGGFSEDSRALEQIGTAADCAATGAATYYAWYELVPAAPVRIELRVFPGNRMSAVVVVNGGRVIVRIRNLTRRTLFTKRLTMAAPDVSSAEWIAEAPAACDSRGECRVLPLTNFGTVSFSKAAAQRTDGHSGTITDPAWTATAIALVPDAGTLLPASAVSGAVPGALSADGAEFSVAWQASSGLH